MSKARLYHRPSTAFFGNAPEAVVIELFTNGRDVAQVVIPWWAYQAIRTGAEVARTSGELARPIDDVVVEVKDV